MLQNESKNEDLSLDDDSPSNESYGGKKRMDFIDILLQTRVMFKSLSLFISITSISLCSLVHSPQSDVMLSSEDDPFSSSWFEPVFEIHCLAALDLGADNEQLLHDRKHLRKSWASAATGEIPGKCSPNLVVLRNVWFKHVIKTKIFLPEIVFPPKP